MRPMTDRGWLQWLVVPLWGCAMLIHQTVVPFPPWASRTGGPALLVLLTVYAAGAILQIAGSASSPRAPGRILHQGSRLVFLLGGCAVWILHGRPDYLASAWALFLLTGYLGPR